ncbi:MAG TPA: SIR2 family protein [Pyrinomonadaceae bacterium]|nr:SIR2 family protein [Pyrinomonadaceae bacterium]
MSIDLTTHESKLLLRQFEKGNVVLFAGAGFSIGATNRIGEDPPLGNALGEILAAECGWPYEGEDLPIVYAQARAHLGAEGLESVLNNRYRDCKPAAWHLLVAKLFWHRIYTTNIDDVIENVYSAGSSQILDRIVCPAPYRDQDQFYDHVQCVHLHGSVLDNSKPLTFTFEEFADQTAKANPWYQAMVDDMQSKSFIFVGTRLTDSPFHHYLGLRGQRSRGTTEYRAKAFLVVPKITPILRRQFADQNIVVIEATGDEFFSALVPAVLERIPSRLDLLAMRHPHQMAALRITLEEAQRAGVAKAQMGVLRQFEYVTGEVTAAAERPKTFFFDGAEPSWQDIAHNVDAKRLVTNEFLEALQSESEGVRTFVLLGQAGSGKSTTMRRLAFELARSGHTVYFSKTAQSLERESIRDLIRASVRSLYFFIDDARSHVRAVDTLVRELIGDADVTFVLADRPHILLPKLHRAHKSLKEHFLDMPLLVKEDCERIIDKLDEFGLLGELAGKSRKQQLREFLGRSWKQLLVAMKEATSGRGFNTIIEDEYRTLASDNARLAYTITCLAYMHAAPVRRRHLLACLEGNDVQKASTLNKDLRGVVVPWKDNEEFLAPRHRVIAQHVAIEAATIDVKQAAIKEFLIQISAEVTPYNIRLRTPEYIAYRGIINFDNMLQLLGVNYELISDVYDELKDHYRDDFLFWLQYGRAEVYFDNFATAENYLNQSLGIRSLNNFQAKHNLGVLFLKRALSQENAIAAVADIELGKEILLEQIRERGDIDAYPYSALIKHMLRYLLHYRPQKMGEELEELKKLADLGHQKHPLDDAMKGVQEEAYRAYLMQAVKGPESSAVEWLGVGEQEEDD